VKEGWLDGCVEGEEKGRKEGRKEGRKDGWIWEDGYRRMLGGDVEGGKNVEGRTMVDER